MAWSVLLLGLGCFLGGSLLGWVAGRFSGRGVAEEEYEELQELLQRQEMENAKKEEMLRFLEGELGDVRGDLESRQRQMELLREQQVREETLRKSADLRLEEQRRDYGQLREQMKQEFGALANALFEEKTASFQRMNRESLQGVLGPLGERIAEFRQRVESVHSAETRERGELREQLRQLGELNAHISREARNLTRALKGSSKVMGDWGEMVLERVLETAGLQRDREYRIQPSYTTPEGKRYRPDVVVFLPRKRHLVIDSKVSLVAWERYCSEESPEERQKHLKEHLASLERHLASLESKGYQNLEELGSPDFVFMFVPLDPALLAAQQEEPLFLQKAWEQGIFPVSPGTLLFALRTVGTLWSREKQNRHALEIARQSGALYDKFVLFYEELESLGEHLDKARNCYQGCRQRLVSGRGNLVSRAEQLRELGARARKELPREVAEEAGEVFPET